MSTHSEMADVIVVGGGPAGACAAIDLAQGGARVVLVEQGRFPRAKLCGEFISPECLPHFARLGVGGRMLSAGACAVTETVFYTRGGRRAAVPSEWFGAAGGAALGLSRAEMDGQLLKRAREVGVEVLEETRATALVVEGGRVRGVCLKNGGAGKTERRALVTLDATGRTRALARMLEHGGSHEARRRGEDEGRRPSEGGVGVNQRRVFASEPSRSGPRRAPLVAFKAHLEGARGSAGACEIYFYRGGYGGISPVENGLSNLCFIVSARDVRALGGDPERVLREVVQANARARETLKEARACTRWLSVALDHFGRRDAAPAGGLLAVGDAASFIDPFTGSGMLMALESGALAADVLAQSLPALRAADDASEPYAALAGIYGARYAEHFSARLRLCSWLRRAAFAPRAVTALAVAALGASVGLRRVVARATRGSVRGDFRPRVG
ncbi:MAG TPA: FAD-dependent monooxygenase [Pyrinomonadaceae bacterium]|nr:FAD-dependent monooxygenase [Pyrinomonadaceae bacterium]